MPWHFCNVLDANAEPRRVWQFDARSDAFNLKGEFVSRPFQHDNGKKTIFGKTGNYDGDDVLNILLEQKQTAKHITEKLYKFLVNETPDTKNIEWLADRFYKNDYDISKLCEDIFTSDWFYD